MSLEGIQIDHAKTLAFFKEAFCVDGEVRFATKNESLSLVPGRWIRLEDSKRGVFYIARNV